MRHERDIAVIRGVERGETRQVERSGVNGVKRRIDRPFEPCNPRQVRQRGRRRKTGEEFRKTGAVFVEPGAPRRLCFDEEADGALEERRANEAADRRIDQPERGRQIAGPAERLPQYLSDSRSLGLRVLDGGETVRFPPRPAMSVVGHGGKTRSEYMFSALPQ